MPSWSFLSNHGAVLVLVATQPRITATEIGSRLGITERPVRRLIAELEAAGYIRRTREGRANRYEVNPVLPLPGPVFRDLAVGDLIDILQARSPEGARSLRDGSYPGS
jgi:DNA-binding transcriptional ArsR family regulator